MSSDMMIICKEDKSSYKEGNAEAAFFIDECSMGEPWSEFGKWFGQRYCRAPSMMDQLHGIHEHNFSRFTEGDFLSVELIIEKMECHERLDKKELLMYLKEHIDKHISTENW